jgi:K+-sensing histidine kinase KdpD
VRTTEAHTGSDDRFAAVAYAVGGLAPVVVAGAMVGVRGEVDTTNVALVLVLIVVATAAFGGRGPAAVSAVLAAVSYEFFFTRPFESLRINSADDVETTLILLAIGLSVGQLAVHARRTRRDARRGRNEMASMRRMAERAAAGAGTSELIEVACEELTRLLSLLGCRYEADASGPTLPVLERTGRIESHYRRVGADGELALPPLGVRLPVVGNGHQVGSIVLDPDPEVGVTLEARVVAVAIADQLGAALAAHHEGEARG